MFLPSRDASTLDLFANVAGSALGAVGALALARSRRPPRAWPAFRDHWFLPGKVGDLGLALLVIWLAVQVNPGIPLFATTFDPDIELDPALATVAAPASPTTSWRSWSPPRRARSSCWASGLFLALLLRQRRYVGGAVLVLDRHRAARQGRRRGAAAQAGRVGALALARRVGRRGGRRAAAARRHLAAAAGAGRAGRDRAAVVGADAAAHARHPVRARAAVRVQLVVRPAAQLQRTHARGAAGVAVRGQRAAVRAGRTSRLGRAGDR